MKLSWRSIALHLGVLLLVAAAAWGLAVWHWESSHRVVSERDLLLYLVAVPLLAWGALLVLRRAWQQAGAPAGAAAAPASGASPDAPAHAPSGRPVGAEHFPILWQQVVSTAGPDTDALAAALATGQLRPALDDELRDPDGAKLLSGRIASLDTAAVGDALRAIAGAPADDTPIFVRTLALMSALWPGAQAAAAAWAAIDPPDEAEVSPSRPRELAIWIALPESIPDEHLPLVRAWAERDLAGPQHVIGRMSLNVTREKSGEALLRRADAALAQARQGDAPLAVLVMVADSGLDDAWVEHQHAQGELLSGPRTSGRVPGEAAAAVLLVSHEGPVPPGSSASAGEAAAPVRVGRLSAARLEAPAPAHGKVSSRPLAEALDAAARAFGVSPAAVAAAVTDTDLQARTMAECVAALHTQCPDLDPVEDVRRLGEALGNVGVATPLCLLALAAAESRERQAPVAVLACSHATERVALLVGPSASAPHPAAA